MSAEIPEYQNSELSSDNGTFPDTKRDYGLLFVTLYGSELVVDKLLDTPVNPINVLPVNICLIGLLYIARKSSNRLKG